jgi:LDH2 family malate/lactate/ureidoglycolate dehydrogenase
VLHKAEDLRRLSQSILEAVGTPEDLAAVVAESLVDANLAGHDSHGVIRIPSYIAAVRRGQVQPAARAHRHPLGGACARVDGEWGWGQPAARLAVEAAVEIAAKEGVGLVAVGRCNHIGRLGEYVERLGAAGMMGMATCNARPAVAPYGGYTRLLGTNPVAWSAPHPADRPPVVVDFATSTIAEGKLRVASANGGLAPQGALLDKTGQPTQDPAAYYDGGALTTFGGHKGFGLSVMAELMAGILSGSGPSALPAFDNGNGTLILAIDLQRFLPMDAFLEQVEAFSSSIRAAPPVAGVDEVMMPGEPEWRSRRRRAEEGVPVPAATYQAIVDVAAELVPP